MNSLNDQERENYVRTMDLWLECEKAIQRVRELHNQIGEYCGYCADIGSCCNPKDFEYPCPTIKALDGEQ